MAFLQDCSLVKQDFILFGYVQAGVFNDDTIYADSAFSDSPSELAPCAESFPGQQLIEARRF